MIDFPAVRLASGRERRVASGHPWVYSNEIAPDAALKDLAPGGLVRVEASDGRFVATATYNPKTLIAARVLTRDAGEAIDDVFFHKRLTRAIALRQGLYESPFYRVAHAEADGLPATIIDRYGDVLVVQTNSAGAERLQGLLLDALEAAVKPRAIVLRNDSPVRALEGLEEFAGVARGRFEGNAPVEENGARFEIPLLGGQKTGWFYDQRDNRAFVARLAAGQPRVLDVYAYAGGFGVQCALAGARTVLAIDRSEAAIEMIAAAAALNGVANRITAQRGEAFGALEALGRDGEKFEVVIADPPAFVKSRKDLNGGLRAYAKLTRLAAALVKPGGYLFIASCSHNASVEDFGEAVAKGLSAAGRTGRILRASGAAPDHPVDPFLPESAYLKALTLQLD